MLEVGKLADEFTVCRRDRSRRSRGSSCRNSELVSSRSFDKNRITQQERADIFSITVLNSLRNIFLATIGSKAGHLLGYRFLQSGEYFHGRRLAATRPVASYGYPHTSSADGLEATWAGLHGDCQCCHSIFRLGRTMQDVDRDVPIFR